MKKTLVSVVSVLIAILVVVGCVYWYKTSVNKEIVNGENNEEQISSEALFTKENYPRVDASTAIQPLVDSITANFLNIPVDEVEIEYTNTHPAYTRLVDGEVDAIFVSEPSEEEKAYAKEKGVELNVIPTTSSAFVFIVNKENPVSNLTLEQVRKIYAGEITNWKEVGGEDEEIIPYQRPTNSGSQTGMLSLVMKDKKMMDPPKEYISFGMGDLVDAVAEYDNAKNALGYSYYYYVNTMYKRDTIKMLAIDGVEPNIETIKNGKYPIYTNGYIVVRGDEKEDGNTMKWVNAVLSKRGSKVIEDSGYVPVN